MKYLRIEIAKSHNVTLDACRAAIAKVGGQQAESFGEMNGNPRDFYSRSGELTASFVDGTRVIMSLLQNMRGADDPETFTEVRSVGILGPTEERVRELADLLRRDLAQLADELASDVILDQSDEPPRRTPRTRVKRAPARPQRTREPKAAPPKRAVGDLRGIADEKIVVAGRITEVTIGAVTWAQQSSELFRVAPYVRAVRLMYMYEQATGYGGPDGAANEVLGRFRSALAVKQIKKLNGLYVGSIGYVYRESMFDDSELYPLTNTAIDMMLAARPFPNLQVLAFADDQVAPRARELEEKFGCTVVVGDCPGSLLARAKTC